MKSREMNRSKSFGERIKMSIEERKAVAATDASVKDRKMGGC